MRVMIVDDSRAQRMMLRRMVETLGFETEEAAHGQEALDKLSVDDPVDLMLVDWNMPVLDGLGATAQIRSDGIGGDPRIVSMSASILEEDRRACLDAGMDDFMDKPIRLENLAKLLEDLPAA